MKMIKKLFVFASLLFSTLTYANPIFDVTVKGVIIGMEKDVPIKIYCFESNKDVGKTTLSETGSFEMKLIGINPGVYKLTFGKYKEEKYLDIVLSGKEPVVTLEINISSPNARPHFRDSKKNEDWYDHKAKVSSIVFKIDLLGQFVNYYPDKGDVLHKEAQRMLFKTRSKLKSTVNEYVAKHPGFSGKMVKNMPEWLSINATATRREKDIEHIEAYWKQPIVDDDESMINTPLYVHHANKYINLFFKNYDIKEGEPKIKEAIDKLMNKFGKNEKIKKQVTYVLMNKFLNSTVLEPLLQYVDQNYLDASMLKGDELKAYAIRLATYRDLKKGEVPPIVYYQDANKKEIPFTELKSKYLILAFWESTCTHCKEQMPKLNDFLKIHKDYKTIALSMDENKYSYEKFVPKLDQMLHYCNFKGGDDKVFQKYYITSTPTLYLLDENKKLIKKFGSVDELEYDDKLRKQEEKDSNKG